MLGSDHLLLGGDQELLGSSQPLLAFPSPNIACDLGFLLPLWQLGLIAGKCRRRRQPRYLSLGT